MNTDLNFNWPNFSDEFLTCSFQAPHSLVEQDPLQKSSQSQNPILKQSKKIHKDKTSTETWSTQANTSSSSSSINTTTKTSNNNDSRKYWSPEEDAQVIELYNKYGSQWAKIALVMKTRTRKQIRDRYINFLRSDINNREWTPEEEQLLKILHDKYGNKWCKIAAEMPGRTESQVKNKFYCPLKTQNAKQLRKVMQPLLTESSESYQSPLSQLESHTTDEFFCSLEEKDIWAQPFKTIFKDSFVDINFEILKSGFEDMGDL